MGGVVGRGWEAGEVRARTGVPTRGPSWEMGFRAEGDATTSAPDDITRDSCDFSIFFSVEQKTCAQGLWGFESPEETVVVVCDWFIVEEGDLLSKNKFWGVLEREGNIAFCAGMVLSSMIVSTITIFSLFISPATPAPTLATRAFTLGKGGGGLSKIEKDLAGVEKSGRGIASLSALRCFAMTARGGRGCGGVGGLALERGDAFWVCNCLKGGFFLSGGMTRRGYEKNFASNAFVRQTSCVCVCGVG